MCNRYENRGDVSRIRRLVRALGLEMSTTPGTDNLAPQDNIYPDQRRADPHETRRTANLN